MTGSERPPSRLEALPDEVYDVLVEECHAPNDVDARREFRYAWPTHEEYRFVGALGFGGKVWHTRDRIYVTCYPENRTPERLAMIDRANERLAELDHA